MDNYLPRINSFPPKRSIVKLIKTFWNNLKRKQKISLLVLIFSILAIPILVGSVSTIQHVRSWAAENPDPTNEPNFATSVPLNISEPIYGFTIDGNVSLNKDNSFIRVVLVDKSKNEYLVYETYSAISDQKTFSVNNTCEETCVLESVLPDHLRLEGNSAKFDISKTSFISDKTKISSQMKTTNFKAEKDNIKITKLNEIIKKKGLRWVAGETSISKLTYAQKKKLFSDKDGKPVEILPNLQGFEFYKSGIFETKTPSASVPASSSNYTAQWDWRNVHGENWLTPVKDQESYGTCMFFSATAALESLVNLYQNRHKNYDFSEQNLIDCYEQIYSCLHATACLLSAAQSSYMAMEEFCAPYKGNPRACRKQCANSARYDFSDIATYIWPLDIYNYYQNPGANPYVQSKLIYPSIDNIKKELIVHGPMPFGKISWYHDVLLVGYETVGNDFVVIFKNSWGKSWGEGGYGKAVLYPQNLLYFEDGATFVSLAGINPINPNEINCVDKDNDHYCNWGLSATKPSTCPKDCLPQKDCDDSNPKLGQYNSSYNCVRITPPSPTPKPSPSPKPTCVPKPTCPKGAVCELSEPGDGGWCLPTPTPTL